MTPELLQAQHDFYRQMCHSQVAEIDRLIKERDAYQRAADDCAAECKSLRDGGERISARVLDANKAWSEYQGRQEILRVFEEDAK